MLQGKYLNNPEVLREAASAAGVQDFERVLSDPTVALNQVRAEAIRVGSHWPHPDEVQVPRTHKHRACDHIFRLPCRLLSCILIAAQLQAWTVLAGEA